MKNLKFVLFLLLPLVGCKDDSVLEEYRSIQGVWKVQEVLPEDDHTLQILDLSCNPSKKLVNDTRHVCGGYINNTLQDEIQISYKIEQVEVIHIKSIVMKSDYNASTPELTALKKLLQGEWNYTINQNAMIWSNEEGRTITFSR